MKNKYLQDVIYTNSDIKNAIKEGAKWANAEFKGTRSPVIIVGILDGCIALYGQILTQLKFSLITDFMRFASFEGQEERAHSPQLNLDLSENTKKLIKNKSVLVIDDIISTGLTTKLVYDEIMKYEPKEIKFLFLFNQKNTRLDYIKNYTIHTCLDVENVFLVGYGLDYQNKYRNLNCVGVLKEKYYKK